MGCTIQKKGKGNQCQMIKQQQIGGQETQIQSQSPKIENLIIETPSQINLRAQRLKHVRDIILSGYSNSPKNIHNSRKQSSQNLWI
ncbi:unnamed protein product [Paramecium primaurelia]|uniref:Uncharacterized protein n=1 Tax=Paramecium primaurelia TaxID=5886 RepID=A0A8S1N653_PARPR|nr:unnamed protein product [Paramecium primaurelia]